MQALIDPTSSDYAGQRDATLANAVYLRLMTPLGRYWAASGMGSRLHELQREKDLPRVRRLAQQYAEQALRPLLDDGRASSIEVSTEQPQAGWCALLVRVVDHSGQENLFRHHVRVA